MGAWLRDITGVPFVERPNERRLPVAVPLLAAPLAHPGVVQIPARRSHPLPSERLATAHGLPPGPQPPAGKNNFAARNLRAQALGRANWLFAVGHESAENTAGAYTVVQTAKLHGLNAEAYLTRALERDAACAARPQGYAALTPMVYEEAQKGPAE